MLQLAHLPRRGGKWLGNLRRYQVKYVRMKEKERERERESVCVCVCVRERESRIVVSITILMYNDCGYKQLSPAKL
jgi:hypothetical protein